MTLNSGVIARLYVMHARQERVDARAHGRVVVAVSHPRRRGVARAARGHGSSYHRGRTAAAVLRHGHGQRCVAVKWSGAQLLHRMGRPGVTKMLAARQRLASSKADPCSREPSGQGIKAIWSVQLWLFRLLRFFEPPNCASIHNYSDKNTYRYTCTL